MLVLKGLSSSSKKKKKLTSAPFSVISSIGLFQQAMETYQRIKGRWWNYCIGEDLDHLVLGSKFFTGTDTCGNM